MYMDKVLKALNEYDATVESASDLWSRTKKQLEVDYGGYGKVFEEKFAAGKELYETTLEKAKTKGLATVKEEFANLRKAIKEFITAPVPSDFLMTLEAVKAMGKGITEEEAKVYLEKYRTNYMAYRSLAETIQEQTGKKQFAVAYDAINMDIGEYEGYVTRFFDSTANECTKAIFMSEKHSPLLRLDASLYDFMTKDVGSYTDPEATQEW